MALADTLALTTDDTLATLEGFGLATRVTVTRTAGAATDPVTNRRVGGAPESFEARCAADDGGRGPFGGNAGVGRGIDGATSNRRRLLLSPLTIDRTPLPFEPGPGALLVGFEGGTWRIFAADPVRPGGAVAVLWLVDVER